MLPLIAMILGQTSINGNVERDELISRAMASARTAIARAEADPERPAFHYRAPALWMNDPNGPIYSGGWYHVFYQFNPYGDHWGNMHWGHARSRNLVDWEDLPVALWPSKAEGEDHIYSGSCFLPPGSKTPVASYTSISGRRAPEQWAAVPEDPDLMKWRKAPENPVVTSDLQEWRDPFVFAYQGAAYMITGGGKSGHGIVALYRAKDASLRSWEYHGILFDHPDADVANIECPNLARIGSKWVLLVSVHGRVESFVGELDGSMRFHFSERGVLNEGSYASQLLLGPKGRVIHLAWVPTDNHAGWNGFLTLPSVLTISDGHLVREPIPELQALRKEKVTIRNTEVGKELDLSSKVSGELLELIATVEFRGAREFGIKLRRSGDGSRSVTLRYPSSTGVKTIHLFLDRGVVDEYVGSCRTIKFSAKAEDQGVSLFAEGGTVQIQALTVYKLRPAHFDLSRYR